MSASARWLTDALARVDVKYERAATESLYAWIRAEPPELQIAVLKDCVERLPSLRLEAQADRAAYHQGSVLYGVACALYGDRLPYHEDDICAVLRASRHDCGHGGDVTRPFDLAVEHMRRFGPSPGLLEAIGEFVEGLRGIQSAQASHLKRRAALVFVLDTDGRVAARPCWSDRFREALGALPSSERVLWNGLVLRMSCSEQPRLPAVWRKTATRFVERLGVAHVAQRLADWWPAPRPEPWPLESGGSQLLRHFVWMLQVMRERASAEERLLCDGLVRQLASVDWKPRERAKKVAVAAASYLVECAPDVAADALLRLGQWTTALKYSDWEPNRTAVLARDYARTHGLDVAAFAKPHEVKKPQTPMPTPPPPRDPAVPPSPEPETWYRRMLGSLRRALSFG